MEKIQSGVFQAVKDEKEVGLLQMTIEIPIQRGAGNFISIF